MSGNGSEGSNGLDKKQAMIAACYSRISTTTHDQQLSSQIEPIKAFAAARGFELVHFYQDEGISGAVERRKGLDSLLADAKRGRFKHLIVMEISRLARDVRHLLNTLHELDRIGVHVTSIREGIEFGSPMGRAMVAMIGILMGVERQLLSDRIKSSLYTRKLLAQRNGTGWRCGRKPLSQETVDKVHELRLQGKSIRAIGCELKIGKTSVERILKAGR